MAEKLEMAPGQRPTHVASQPLLLAPLVCPILTWTSSLLQALVNDCRSSYKLLILVAPRDQLHTCWSPVDIFRSVWKEESA